MQQILDGTPGWVWGLLTAMIALGLAQAPERRVGRGAVLLLPTAVVAVSAFALLAAFGPDLGAAVLSAGAAVAGFAFNQAVARSPVGVTTGGASVYVVPGSWLPTGLIVAIFAARFAVGLTRAANPIFAASLSFTALVSSVIGFSCGVMVSRAAVILATPRLT